MNPLLHDLLGESTRLTRTGRLAEATAAIQRALGGLGSTPPSSAAPPKPEGGAPSGLVLDGLVHEIDTPDGEPPTTPDRQEAPRADRRPPVSKAPGTEAPLPSPRFDSEQYQGPAGTRTYKLFVPAGFDDRPLPLVVMLHGCTQGPDDFALGTGMNEIAQQRGFLVLYPAQAPRSNASKCWNWFNDGDQHRGAGEPELLAGMTRHILQTRSVDPARVYVAGLSAGGAMADILGREYPDLFAAVGVHSGLPQGAAHDVASAFAAMSQGSGASAGTGLPSGLPGALRRPRRAAAERRASAPTIVFHGDADSTVHPSNGNDVVEATLRAAGSSDAAARATRSTPPSQGRRSTRTVHHREGAAPGEPSLAEHWAVHGGAHAWSGGNPAGSFTDARGPDASLEMVRFFEEHPMRRA